MNPKKLNTLSVPAMLLSGILLPMSLAPHWLRVFSRMNPFTYIVDAARTAMGPSLALQTLWLGAGVAVGLALVGLFGRQADF